MHKHIINKIWNKLFLEHRPSIALSAFRPIVALTVAAVVLPSFVYFEQNYFPGAFKTYNSNFFPVWFLQLVATSPTWVIVLFKWLFMISCFFFLIGFLSQISAILVMASCYYFYALNAFHVSTLSWDILLVTLFLMCVTPYPGDYFSLDCLRRSHIAYRISKSTKNDIRNTKYEIRKRPFFIQRLLQLQIAFTFFYTALYKVYPAGNWITDNPIYYLMNMPHAGVVKTFILKDILSTHPTICYWIGLSIIAVEFSMIFLLFYRPTRNAAIYLGIFFHILLILTLDVPATFFFLFPPMLLLFINPNEIEQWIQSRKPARSTIIYDGNCQFCVASVERLKIMDLFDALEYADFNAGVGLRAGPNPGGHGSPPLPDEQTLRAQLHLIEPNGHVTGGFDALRRLSLKLPMLYPLSPILYFPGMRFIGRPVYRFVARNRHLWQCGRTCKTI